MSFLSQLFEKDDLILIRHILDGRVHTQYVSRDDRVSASSWNTFFGVCPRTAPGADKASDITTVRCLWVDIDDTMDWKSRCENVPQPTFVVLTGGGIQCYWKLLAAISPSVAVPRLKWLVRETGADHCHDVARVLRLPGTINRKYNPPRHCCVIREFDNVYEFSRFPEVLPLPVSSYQPCTKWDSSVSPRLLDYVETVAITPVGQRSSKEFALVCYAISTGHHPEAVWAAVSGVGKFAEKGRAYFDRTWENALLKVGTKNSV